MGLMAKGDKKFSKTVKNPKTGKKRTVRYGAKGYSIAPGTSKGDSHCARSYRQMKKHPKAAKHLKLTSAPVSSKMEVFWKKLRS